MNTLYQMYMHFVYSLCINTFCVFAIIFIFCVFALYQTYKRIQLYYFVSLNTTTLSYINEERSSSSRNSPDINLLPNLY